MICSCHSSEDKPNADYALRNIDDIVFMNPKLAKSILDTIRIDSLDLASIAKYNLLLSINDFTRNNSVSNDSIVRSAYYYYSKNDNKKNLYNLARAELFLAIADFDSPLSKDTSAYEYLKEAQFKFTKIDTAYRYSGITYLYLSKYNTIYGLENESINYVDKAYEEFSKTFDTLLIYSAIIEKAYIYLYQRNIQEVKNCIDIIDISKISSDYILYQFYTLNAEYYMRIRNISNALEYQKKIYNLKKIKNIKVPAGSIYYTLSRYYYFLEDFDTAVLYGKLAIDSSINKIEQKPKLHSYYYSYGELLEEIGRYNQASEAFRKGYQFSYTVVSSNYKKKLTSVESKYDTAFKEIEREKESVKTTLFMMTFLLSVLILTIVIYLLAQKVKLAKEISKNHILKEEMLEKELKQSKGMIDIVSVSLGILPRFIERVNNLSAKTFSTNPELYEVFQKEIDQAKGETRKRLLNIVNSDSVLTISPFLKDLNTLSNQEKMILLLLQSKYNNKSIANILNITESSVRGSKVKIKRKIQESDLSSDIVDNLLSVF